jgi:hypothetical protein
MRNMGYPILLSPNERHICLEGYKEGLEAPSLARKGEELMENYTHVCMYA